MIPSIRDHFNATFTEAAHQDFVHACQDRFNKIIEFKICETPIFIPADFSAKVLAAGEAILDVVCADDFKLKSDKAIPNGCFVPGAEGRQPLLHWILVFVLMTMAN